MPSEKAKRLGDLNRKRKAAQDLAHDLKVLQRSRPIDSDIGLSNAGILKMRIWRFASFGNPKPYIWDIREAWENGAGVLKLYINELESMERIAPGYEQIEISHEELEKIKDKVSQFSIPLNAESQSGMGLDGTTYGLTIYSGMFKHSVEWWEDLENELRGLSVIIKEAVDRFEAR
jgi:hypothetical protein